MTARIGILGGSFDPVHPGHIALGRAASIALKLDEMVLIPTARSWQKDDARASAAQRLEMLELALQAEGLQPTPGTPENTESTESSQKNNEQSTPPPCRWRIDRREIDRGPPTYTIDTLVSLREELKAPGRPETALCLILGSDQFVRLDTWFRWRELLDYCHIAVTTRLPTLLTHLSGEPELLMQQKGVAALPDAPAGKITTFRMQSVHLSSTQIRGMLSGNVNGDQRGHPAGTSSGKPQGDRKLGLELLHPPVAACIERLGLYL